jgi:hypothetical protein
MSPPQTLISSDGQWWWDGQQWLPMRRGMVEAPDVESQGAGLHLVIPIHHPVARRYSPEPAELRARYGSVLLIIGFVLSLPAMFVGTLFSMAVATGQAPAWPTIGEGVFFFLIVLGVLGGAPLFGMVLWFGVRDGARWVLLCLACSGVMPGLVLGGIFGFAAPQAPATDLITTEVAVAWMWALPAGALALTRVTRFGGPLPPAGAYLRMFGSGWRKKLPGLQTQWGEVAADGYRLRVPGAVFSMPVAARHAVLAAGGRARVTYDLQRGRIETIEVGA